MNSTAQILQNIIDLTESDVHDLKKYADLWTQYKVSIGEVKSGIKFRSFDRESGDLWCSSDDYEICINDESDHKDLYEQAVYLSFDISEFLLECDEVKNFSHLEVTADYIIVHCAGNISRPITHVMMHVRFLAAFCVAYISSL